MREKILEASIRLFNKKGLKFTMDDIANELSISKKTIYTVFRDKEAMLYSMVDFCFDNIAKTKKGILEDENLSTRDKIRNILVAMPDSYQDIDFSQLYNLRDKFPKIYARVEKRLEPEWEETIALLNRGMEEGVIRKVSIPILKAMLEASLERFFQRDTLVVNEISYKDALQQVLEILLWGIEEREL